MCGKPITAYPSSTSMLSSTLMDWSLAGSTLPLSLTVQPSRLNSMKSMPDCKCFPVT